MSELSERLLKDLGYTGEELLMHPDTAYVGEAKDWASEAADWDDVDDNEESSYERIREQFASLIEVKETEDSPDGDKRFINLEDEKVYIGYV